MHLKHIFVFIFIMIFVCCTYKNRESAEDTNNSAYYSKLEFHKENIIYDTNLNSYGQMTTLTNFDPVGTFFFSYQMCRRNNSTGCFNCYSTYSYFLQYPKKYKTRQLYMQDSLIAMFYLLKAYELGSDVAKNIVQAKFGKTIPKSENFLKQIET